MMINEQIMRLYLCEMHDIISVLGVRRCFATEFLRSDSTISDICFGRKKKQKLKLIANLRLINWVMKVFVFKKRKNSTTFPFHSNTELCALLSVHPQVISINYSLDFENIIKSNVFFHHSIHFRLFCIQ